MQHDNSSDNVRAVSRRSKRLRAEDDGIRCSQLVCLDIEAGRPLAPVTSSAANVKTNIAKTKNYIAKTAASLPMATVQALLPIKPPCNALAEAERLSKVARKASTGGHHTWVQNSFDKWFSSPVGQQAAEQIGQGIEDGSIPAMDPVERLNDVRTPVQADTWLLPFFSTVRKDNGDLYNPSSFTGFYQAVNRFFEWRHEDLHSKPGSARPYNELDLKSTRFSHLKNVKNNRNSEAFNLGIGNVTDQAWVLPEEDSLRFMEFFNNELCFGVRARGFYSCGKRLSVRGGTELADIKTTDFRLLKDAKGRNQLVYNQRGVRKTFNDRHKRPEVSACINHASFIFDRFSA